MRPDGARAGQRTKGQTVATLDCEGFTNVDYFELSSCAELKLLDRLPEPARLFAAARLARMRLIDNIDVPGDGRY